MLDDMIERHTKFFCNLDHSIQPAINFLAHDPSEPACSYKVLTIQHVRRLVKYPAGCNWLTGPNHAR